MIEVCKKILKINYFSHNFKENIYKNQTYYKKSFAFKFQKYFSIFPKNERNSYFL
jgi:hypothetical protein